MIDALKNIFEPKATVTVYATIRRRLSSSRYEVADLSDRIFYAEATEFYPSGVEVVIQNGRIVGPGSRAGKHRIYEV